MVCTVKYMPSEKEELRHAVFKGIRDNKIPEECKLYKWHFYSLLLKIKVLRNGVFYIILI